MTEYVPIITAQIGDPEQEHIGAASYINLIEVIV